MKRIKPVAGLLLLCGLCFCAFGASNASALTLGTLPLNTSTAVTPTLTETTSTGTTGETNGIHAVLHQVVAGVSFQITCTGLTSTDSTVENKEVAGSMTFEGTGTAKFTGCALKTPTQCTVPTELRTTLLKQTTSEMKVIFKPNSGETFITIPVTGASCPAAFKGEKTITGEAVGTVTEAEPQAITFNSASGNNIKFGGVAGAQFTAKIHLKKNSNSALLAAETP